MSTSLEVGCLQEPTRCRKAQEWKSAGAKTALSPAYALSGPNGPTPHAASGLSATAAMENSPASTLGFLSRNWTLRSRVIRKGCVRKLQLSETEEPNHRRVRRSFSETAHTQCPVGEADIESVGKRAPKGEEERPGLPRLGRSIAPYITRGFD